MNLLLIAVAAGIYFISKNKKGINIPDATTKSAVIKNNIGPLVKAKADQLKSQQELVLQNKQNQNMITSTVVNKRPPPKFQTAEQLAAWNAKNANLNIQKDEKGRVILPKP